ncbi:MAG: enoyl-CoA hydratase-related protein [Armatimonadota bacterium]|nr:enoyl-CoA hydratase-related protein [Armatimonadota bacterium]MDR5697492.1 enoyl-CoA hydratase-related protein [Armatimonadota bacterium]
MTFENILTSVTDGVATIQINRPKVLNALNRQTMDEIVAALQAFDADEAVRVVILTGDERAFAAGADINEFAGATPVQMLHEYRFEQWERIRRFPKPIVAAVSGFCLGGGNELAMLCDIIVASETARFGQPEINLGIMPGAGGTQRLPRAVGKHRAMELILTGRHLTAREAYDWGLVNRVVPPEMLLDEARALAREIAAKAPVAVRLAKEAVLKSLDTPLEVGLDHERRLFYLLFGTEDKEEGIAAFLEKRRPVFRGR